jgi:hypothetical protein
MISVIICSVDSELLTGVTSNIKSTIGVPYELIAIDNRNSNKGICRIYNEAAEKAIYEVLCFIHEDVTLLTNNWGQKIINCISQPNIGLVGLSGSVYKSKYPGTWSACHSSFYRISNIKYDTLNDIFSEVAVIDGCFMAVNKKVFNKIKFDEQLLGFHGYDLDLSLNIGVNKSVVVIDGLDFNHLSGGILNSDWFNSSIYIHKKWKSLLSKSVVSLDPRLSKLSDYCSAQCTYNIAYDLRVGSIFLIKYYIKFITIFFHINKLKYTKKMLTFFIKNN